MSIPINSALNKILDNLQENIGSNQVEQNVLNTLEADIAGSSTLANELNATAASGTLTSIFFQSGSGSDAQPSVSASGVVTEGVGLGTGYLSSMNGPVVPGSMPENAGSNLNVNPYTPHCARLGVLG